MFHLRRSPRIGHNPNQPHDFVQPEETRSGDAVLSQRMPSSMQMISAIAVAGASIRAIHCALPGCEKLRDDPIHLPSE
jgi:hypothetical protein